MVQVRVPKKGMFVDEPRCEVFIDGVEIRNLAPKEHKLLVMLFKLDGKVASRDFLLKEFWGIDEGMEIDTRTVDQHIARLRSKLGRVRAKMIETCTGFGYKIRREHHGK